MILSRTLRLASCLMLAATSAAWAQTTDMNAMTRETALRLVERARVEERAGHALRAESLYLRAVGVDRGALDAVIGAARLLDARGRRDEARALLGGVPRRAVVRDGDRVELAGALQGVGAIDAAITLLRSEDETLATLRALVALCASVGRFSEALAAARRWQEHRPLDASQRDEAARTQRALARLVAEADAVQRGDSEVFRRLLRESQRAGSASSLASAPIDGGRLATPR